MSEDRPARLFSARALSLVKDTLDEFARKLKAAALHVATADGRSTVTSEDVKAVLQRFGVPLFDDASDEPPTGIEGTVADRQPREDQP